MITTKRGKTGKASIWLNQKTNFTTFSDKLDYWRDVEKMVLLSDEGSENAGLDPLYIGQKDPSGTYYSSRADIQSGAWPYHTNWPDYLFRDVAINNGISADVPGCNADPQYFGSSGHRSDGPRRGYERVGKSGAQWWPY